MNKLKNVVIINDFNYVQGGASKVAIDTARILKNENLNIFFFSAVDKSSEKISGINYISTNQIEAIKDRNRIRGIINGIYNFKAKRKLKLLLKELDNSNTIIHIHGWTKALSSSIFDIIFKMNFRAIITAHDYFTACPNGGYFNYRSNKICNLKPMSFKCLKSNCDSRNILYKLFRIVRQFVQNNVVKLNKKLKYVVTISDFSENILKGTLSEEIEIYKTINPIDVSLKEDRVECEKNDFYLYVGRISKEKGVELFCAAITELGFNAVVVGDGDEKEKLEKEYKNIKFVGWKEKEDVINYMKKARALIFPSLCYEVSPLTIMEAYIIGLPVVASNTCAGRDLVDEELLFNVESLTDFKNKIEVLTDDDKVKQISINVYEKYKKDYCQIYKDDILKYYREILN